MSLLAEDHTGSSRDRGERQHLIDTQYTLANLSPVAGDKFLGPGVRGESLEPELWAPHRHLCS